MATASELQQLYVAYFGRPADPAGLDYWVSTGISTRSFAALMYAQPEFQSVNSGLSTEAQVNQIYINLFGRSADSAGLLYWTQLISTGRIQLASIANDLIYAANNSGAASAADRAALTNKTNTAVSYTQDIRSTSGALLAYQPQSTNPWVSGTNFATAVSFMSTATSTNAPTSAQISASVATVAANGAPGQTITLTTDRFSYVGGPGNDTFVAGTTAAGQQILNAADTIDGGGGSNRLIATLTQAVSSVASMTNVQNVSVTQTGVGGAFDLTTASGISAFTNNGSSQALTVSGISKATALTWATTGSNFTVTLNDVTGAADAATVTVSNITAGTLAIAGVETLSLVSSGTTNTVTAVTDAAATTLNISGSSNLTITNELIAGTRTINAATASGNITLASDAGNAIITGGSGNDTFTLDAAGGNANLSLVGGAGNDTFIIAATQFNANDTIDGGTGTNTLSVASADVVGAFATTNVAGIQALTLSTGLANTDVLTLANISSGINTVSLADTSAGAYSITGPAGSLSINVGASLGAGGANFTITDTGTAGTDSLTIVNTAAAGNVFAAKAFVIGGYEAVTLNTGTSGVAQTTGAIGITPDLGATGSLTILGSGNLTSQAITARTISASGFGGAFTMGAAAVGAVSITGSAQADTLRASSVAAVIDGGAGNDTMISGGNSDTLIGGLGNDTITIGAGDDSVSAGDGDDTIVAEGNLSAGDTIDGGAGTNILSITAAVAAAAAARPTNFQTLTFAGNGITQDMALFTGTTFTTAVQDVAGDGTLTINNASASLNTLNITETQQLTTGFARAVNTTNDQLVVNAQAAIAAASALTASNEEVVTINGAANNVDLDLATMTQLTTLNINGTGVLVIDALGAGALRTVNASGVTGTNTLNVNAASSTVALTFTGPNSSGNTTLTSGSGNDIITAGTYSASVIDAGNGNDSVTGGLGDDSLTGAAGADTLIGGGGADTLNGGSGNDSLSGGDGNDVIQTSAGADTIDGGAGTNTISVIGGSQDLSIYSISNATTLAMNNLATTMSIAQYNAFTVIGTQAAVTFSDAGTVGGKLGLVTYNLANGANTFTAQADAAAGTSVTGGTGVDTFNFTVANFQTVASTVVGGTGTDTLNITDNTALTVANASTRVLGVETITLANTTTNVSWTQTGDIAGGGVTQFLDASGMTTGTLVFDGSGQTTAAQQLFRVTKGGAGNSTLTGGAGSDTLTGGTGQDTITGGTGADTLTGGSAVDTFVQALGSGGATRAATNLVGGGDNSIVSVVFNGLIDVITDFRTAGSGNDLLDVAGANTSTSVIADGTTVLAANANAWLRGAWNAGTLTFTANAAGADVLVKSSSANAAFNAVGNDGATFYVLRGTNADAVNGWFI